MRQVGVIAAAARIALRDRDRLSEDHELARDLASQLSSIAPDAVDLDGVETNMVQVAVSALPVPLQAWTSSLRMAGIKINPPIAGILRLVTHRDVNKDDVERLLGCLRTAQINR